MNDYINPWFREGAKIPNWIMRRMEIAPGAKLCYARLCQYADKTGLAWPRQSVLALELGCSERSVRDQVAQLVKFKLIESDRRGIGKSNGYRFLKHEWMTEEVVSQEEVASPCGTRVTDGAAPECRTERHPGDGRQYKGTNPIEDVHYEASKKKEQEEASAPSQDKEKFKEFMTGWCSGFREVHGFGYQVVGVRDGPAIKRLVKTGVEINFALEVARKAWHTQDVRLQFEKKQSMSIASFASQFGKISVAVGASVPRVERRRGLEGHQS